MGNCCGGGSNEGEVTIGKKGNRGVEHILDDRTVAGLQGGDKIILIIKI